MRKMSAFAGLTAAALSAVLIGPVSSAAAETTVAEPSSFTSAYTAMATPDMVVNADSVPTPGTAGAYGTFNYRINSDLEIICYDITITGISEPYMSPAKTATHIHQAVAGKAGPPRIAFPNPTSQGNGTFVSSGCLQGPFTTGINAADTGADTGTGFTLAQIEANPASFFTDTHTQASPAGAVRGQLTQVPVGGIETGGGGTASDSTVPAPLALGVGVLAVAGLAFAARRRQSA